MRALPRRVMQPLDHKTSDDIGNASQLFIRISNKSDNRGG